MIQRENALPRQLFDRFKNEVFDRNFPWFYNETTYRSNEDKFSYSFYHLAYFDGRSNSQITNLAEACILHLADTAGYKVNAILRIRLTMLQINPIGHIHPPHVDMDDRHMTGLLYFNNNDGDTILYNEFYNPDDGQPADFYLQEVLKNNVTEFTRVSPKENSSIFFNGHQYHSSSSPTYTNRKVVLNFNFI